MRTLLALAALAAVACGPAVREPPPPAEQDPGLFFSPDAGELLYPPGPYGNAPGEIIRNVTLEGFRTPSSSFGTIALSDFYDPEGVKGPGGKATRALVMNASALWCSACKLEAPVLMRLCTTYREQGLQCYTAIFEDESHNPATRDSVVFWKNRYEIDYPIVLDASLKYGVYFDAAAAPMNMFVDPKTMEILEIKTGFDEKGMEAAIKKYLGLDK